jgi:hypothetical protein
LQYFYIEVLADRENEIEIYSRWLWYTRVLTWLTKLDLKADVWSTNGLQCEKSLFVLASRQKIPVLRTENPAVDTRINCLPPIEFFKIHHARKATAGKSQPKTADTAGKSRPSGPWRETFYIPMPEKLTPENPSKQLQIPPENPGASNSKNGRKIPAINYRYGRKIPASKNRYGRKILQPVAKETAGKSHNRCHRDFLIRMQWRSGRVSTY